MFWGSLVIILLKERKCHLKSFNFENFSQSILEYIYYGGWFKKREKWYVKCVEMMDEYVE